ncbi:LysR family transcriptional regulator [Albidovulum salinarum]|nr:LysR family transcriptional regulator [Defluviimonas sp. WL0024]
MTDFHNAYAMFGRYSSDLCLFVLAAELGKFSAAAEAAGLTQPRLSQRMKSLEEGLGVQLFERGRRGIQLTRRGQDLYQAVAPGVALATAGLSAFRTRPPTAEVLISVDFAFATFRLLPRMPELREAFAALNISVLASQLPAPADASLADISIRMGELRERRPGEVCLMEERVSAVCSPAYLKGSGSTLRPSDLLHEALVDLASPPGAPWMSWTEWLARFGLQHHRTAVRSTFNSYDLVVRSAEAGLGIALGWHGLIDDRLKAGSLVLAVPEQVESRRGYLIGVDPVRATKDARAVYDWIIAAMT